MKIERKNSKYLIVIIILVILVMILGGYIGYDQLLSKDTTNTTKETSENEIQITSDDTKNITNDTINDNQSLKFKYYVSKQQEDSSNSYRFSITLGESNDNIGFFSINLLSQFEGPVASGYYKIDDSKLILSFGPVSDNNDFVNEETIFKIMDATLVNDPNQSNYKAYILDYNDDELQIGNYKLYRVK